MERGIGCINGLIELVVSPISIPEPDLSALVIYIPPKPKLLSCQPVLSDLGQPSKIVGNKKLQQSSWKFRKLLLQQEVVTSLKLLLGEVAKILTNAANDGFLRTRCVGAALSVCHNI